MSFGNDLDFTVGHGDGGLIIDGIYRRWYLGSPFFSVNQRSVRVILVIKMRNQRKVDPSNSASGDKTASGFTFHGGEREGFRGQCVVMTAGSSGRVSNDVNAPFQDKRGLPSGCGTGN